MEKERREDVRIFKTKRDLRAAMLRLLERESFGKLSVSDICAEAMVNRMTFYKHYQDKYDLLNDLILEVKRSIVARCAETEPGEAIAEDPTGFLCRMIEAVADECLERKKLMTSLENDEVVLTMISTTIEKAMRELLTALDRRYPLRYPIDALAAAVTGAASFLIRFWLNHQPEKSKETFLLETGNFFRDLMKADVLFLTPPQI